MPEPTWVYRSTNYLGGTRGPTSQSGHYRPTAGPPRRSVSPGHVYDAISQAHPRRSCSGLPSLDGFAKQQIAVDEQNGGRSALSWILSIAALVIVFVLNIFYMRLTKTETNTSADLWFTGVITSVALLLWVYGINGGIVTILGWYNVILAGFLTAAFTFLVPLIDRKK